MCKSASVGLWVYKAQLSSLFLVDQRTYEDTIQYHDADQLHLHKPLYSYHRLLMEPYVTLTTPNNTPRSSVLHSGITFQSGIERVHTWNDDKNGKATLRQMTVIGGRLKPAPVGTRELKYIA